MFQVPEDAVHVSSGGIGFEFEVADENSLQMEQHMIDICQVEWYFVLCEYIFSDNKNK